MKCFSLNDSSVNCRVAAFSSRDARELHLAFVPSEAAPFETQWQALTRAYADALEHLELSAQTAVFQRLFLSDASNQMPVIERLGLGPFQEPNTALSIIEQPPVSPGARVALWSYHVQDPRGPNRSVRSRISSETIALRRGPLTHLWTAGLRSSGEDSASQTRGIFERYRETLAAAGATLEAHAVRTWLYVRDIDTRYAGMVRARAEVFDSCGLTADTHYIASTGIEGRHAEPQTRVSMDAHAISGLDAAQVRYLTAPEQLGPTHLYGVTFERGVAIDYADRRQVYISGTASIEPGGATLHRFDIGRQIRRTLKNIDGLLAGADMTREDVVFITVYLRDPEDEGAIATALRPWAGLTPVISVRAPVCRPDWLVEIECIALKEHHAPQFPPF